MRAEVVRILIDNEIDLVLGHKRTIQLSEFTGLSVSEQTRLATAISEISRNCLEYARGGVLTFTVVFEKGIFSLEATIADTGKGIPNLEEILERKHVSNSSRGQGIINSRKLVDYFYISSNSKGTVVRLAIKISKKNAPINETIIKGWADFFANERPVSPYEELKKRNIQLLELTEELTLKNLQSEAQLEEIKRLNHELEKSNSELEDFAYTVSHDMKAPLRNLEGLISIIEEEKDGEVQTFFDMLRGQVKQMDQMITNILSYAKSGRENVNKTVVNVAELIKSIAFLLNIPEGFNINIQEDLPTLKTEEIYLQQIFSNLISNAIKYHDKGEGAISVSMKEKNGMIWFSVEDDGPGIPKNKQEEIFKPFNTNNTSKDSTGIGLSIVKKIIEGKGGRVWVESEGRGSKFVFTWPNEYIGKLETI